MTYLYSDTILFIFSSYNFLEIFGYFLYFKVTRGISRILVGILVIFDVLEIFGQFGGFEHILIIFFNTLGVFWSIFGGGGLVSYVFCHFGGFDAILGNFGGLEGILVIF